MVELVRPIPTQGGGDGYTKKEVVDMAKKIKLREVGIAEILTLAADKAYRQERTNVAVFLPPTKLPPCECEPLKATRVESEAYGRVRIFVRPSYRGGWVVEIKFYDLNITFNPALPPKEGAEILKKMKQ